MRMRSRLLIALAGSLIAGHAVAQTCFSNANPFLDVSAGDIFCSDALWLRNAQVTLGCNAENYCPAATVTRAQMALFMRRLATALKPEVAFAESTSGTLLDLDAGAVVCGSSSLVVSMLDTGANARVAQVRANVSLLTTASADVQLRITRSDDGGPFVADHQAVAAATAGGGQWVHLSAISAPHTITPPPTGGAGTSSRWRLELSRVAGSGTAGDVIEHRCQVDLSSVPL